MREDFPLHAKAKTDRRIAASIVQLDVARTRRQPLQMDDFALCKRAGSPALPAASVLAGAADAGLFASRLSVLVGNPTEGVPAVAASIGRKRTLDGFKSP
jgi:hypothetical protein